MKNLIKVALRNQAIYLQDKVAKENLEENKINAMHFVQQISGLGYNVSENTLTALFSTSIENIKEVYDTIAEVKGVKNNWTPLVKGWQKPTNESRLDHLATFVANVFGWNVGSKLPCGHNIPTNTFPLERYNGCPFCGTPFEVNTLQLKNQGSCKTVLNVWNEEDAKKHLVNLLQSKTALDTTQQESLSILLDAFGVLNVAITMKEILVVVIDYLISINKREEAQIYFDTPSDILRYLWYKHTGLLQIVQPKVIVKKAKENNSIYSIKTGGIVEEISIAKSKLALKYNRPQCRMVANWLNNLVLEVPKICEAMHPKRNMWVRMIRALRLAEYSKMEGFEKLKLILHNFYNEDYFVWQGAVDKSRNEYNVADAMELLKQRPGAFTRALFGNMLWFGATDVIKAFSTIMDKVPARLLLTLNAYAKNYFEQNGNRIVKPLGGYKKTIQNNSLLKHYSAADLIKMQEAIENLCVATMKGRFEKIVTKNKTIFIDEALYKMPVSIGERSETVQDIPVALMGAVFPVEGNTVRLFMQWGNGLPAQHLDMDLSAYIVMHNGENKICSYSQLTNIGCKHSGDIREIPNKVGTAEYIEINIEELQNAKAKYVVFTSNAYSMGSLSPNMVIGWMDSKYPMRISEKTGVAYDPSCVQHQVKITQNLNKGLIFGVLNVAEKNIIWLELPFAGQLVQGVNIKSVEAMLSKLSSRLNIGALLQLKAEAQGLEIIETENADEIYTMEWARDAAKVTQLLVD